jgi:predicted nucleic acid-binding protein
MSAPAFGGGRFIADKSIWARSDRDAVQEEWAEALRNGQIATCSITIMELLYSARSGHELEQLHEELTILQRVPVTEEIFALAVGAMRKLAGHSDGFHRLALPDYIIATCAQEAEMGVLHYDHDFDRLAKVLRFESRWAAAPGTLDMEESPD